MNRSYEKNSLFNSDFGIYETFYTEETVAAGGWKSYKDALLCRLLVLAQILCGATARRIARVGIFTLCMVGTIGVAGAIEVGNLSLFPGLAICAGLLTIEWLCLRGRKSKQK